MAHDASPRPSRRLQLACGVGCAGLIAAAFVGSFLAALANQANAPVWVGALAFFGPPVLFTVVMAAIYLPRIRREMREAARNAPSPESVAAARMEDDDDDDTPGHVAGAADDELPVPQVSTTPGRVLAHSLPRADLSPGCQFGCAVLAAVFWNGIV